MMNLDVRLIRLQPAPRVQAGCRLARASIFKTSVPALPALSMVEASYAEGSLCLQRSEW